MAANVLTLTLTSVQLNGIGISVAGRSGTPGNLTTSLIKMRKFSAGAFADFTDFTLSNATPTTATIVASTGGGLFSESDLFLIQINENTDYSDRIYVDFSEAYTSHTAGVQYEMPAQAGDYNLNFQTVNDVDFSSATPSQTLISNVESGTYRLSIDSLNGNPFNVQCPYNIIICNGIDRILSECTPNKFSYISLEPVFLHFRLFDNTGTRVPNGKYLIKTKIEKI